MTCALCTVNLRCFGTFCKLQITENICIECINNSPSIFDCQHLLFMLISFASWSMFTFNIKILKYYGWNVWHSDSQASVNFSPHVILRRTGDIKLSYIRNIHVIYIIDISRICVQKLQRNCYFYKRKRKRSKSKPISIHHKPLHKTKPISIHHKPLHKTKPISIHHKPLHKTKPISIQHKPLHKTKPISIQHKPLHKTKPISIQHKPLTRFAGWYLDMKLCWNAFHSIAAVMHATDMSRTEKETRMPVN